MFRTYAVYHSAFGGSTQQPVAIFGSELPVDQTLEIIFNMTQHLDYAWDGNKAPRHPNVRLMARRVAVNRSTSVGDQIMVDDGTTWEVAGCGFKVFGERFPLADVASLSRTAHLHQHFQMAGAMDQDAVEHLVHRMTKCGGVAKSVKSVIDFLYGEPTEQERAAAGEFPQTADDQAEEESEAEHYGASDEELEAYRYSNQY